MRKPKFFVFITFVLAFSLCLTSCQLVKKSLKEESRSARITETDYEDDQTSADTEKPSENKESGQKKAVLVKKNDSTETESTQDNAEKTPAVNSEEEGTGGNVLSDEEMAQAYVKGATPGSSRSDYIKDREVWRGIYPEKFHKDAERSIGGVHIPEFLLDSEDARTANAEIEEIISELKTNYDEFTKNGTEEFAQDYLGVEGKFSVYQNKDFLSVHLYVLDVSQGYAPIHRIYNFSLPDGRALNNAEILSYFGIAESDIPNLMENTIDREYERISSIYQVNAEPDEYYYRMDNMEGLALKDLWENDADNLNSIYINETGVPHFIYLQYTIAGSGVFVADVPLINEASLKYDQYSEQFIKMAKELNLDLDDENIKGIMVYLGNGYDENSLKEILTKLFPWQIAFEDYEDPKMLLMLEENPEGYRPKLYGQEFYLVIPKMKNAVLSLEELKMNDSGKSEKVDNYYLDVTAPTGPVLLCVNESELFPNAELTIQYRDDKLQFSPYISQENGKVVLPDGIVDGGDLLPWDDLKEKEVYSGILLNNLLSAMYLAEPDLNE